MNETSELAVTEKTAALEAPSKNSIVKAVEHMELVRRFISTALKPDIDYGKIPGVDKPFLQQPGAEKIAMWLRVRPFYETREKELPNGHLEVVATCRLLSIPNGDEMSQSPPCSCSTMESNYRFRWAATERKPTKDEADRLKAAGMGKWKFKKLVHNGKVQRREDGREAGEWIWLERQDNPNIYDEHNKVRQIGSKRALVKAVRTMGALSEIFTEDPSEWNLSDEEEQIENTRQGEPAGRIERDTPVAPPNGRNARHEAPKAQEMPSHSGTETDNRAKIPHLYVYWPPDEDGMVAYLWGDWMPLEAALKNEICANYLKTKEVWAVPGDKIEALHGHVVEIEQVSVFPPLTERQKAAGPGLLAPPRAVIPSLAAPQPEVPAPAAQSPMRITNTRMEKPKPADQKNPSWEPRFMRVEYGGIWYSCWNNKLWEFLTEAKQRGVECHLVTEKRGEFHNIIGAIRMGNVEFMDDGVTPILQRDKPRPKPGSLFA